MLHPEIMITFKPTIRKEKMKEDKTWHVFIQMIYNRQRKFIPTSIFVRKNDLTTSFKIKNQAVLDKCSEIITNYRKKILELNIELNPMLIDTILDFLTTKQKQKTISFSSFFGKWRNTANIKGIGNYVTAYNAFCKFKGKDIILFDEVNVASMREFENSLSDRPRAQSLYTTAIKHIFEEARLIYNDEDNDIITIRHSLDRYTPPKQNVTKKRALTSGQIKAIFALPYDNKMNKGFCSRRDLALDCFRLSFCLMGMNSADLFNATDYKDGTITYYRTKTKDRRNDKAEMQVRVHPYIAPLVEKYSSEEFVFNFHERFSSLADLNRAINIGLKEVGKEVGIDGLQFYSARHSLASIGINEVRIDKYMINDILCHTDRSMRVTDLYIMKDFHPINDANDKIIEYILGNKG